MRASIRVLVVDDSALIRQLLTRALSMDPRIEIVGTARNGVEAIEKARELTPDVVTLDIEMPELTGIEALPHIRKHTNARVVMLTSLDDPETTYKALSAGAVDFLTKPGGGVASSITELTEILLKKIRTAYRISPERAAMAAEAARTADRAEGATDSALPTTISACVAIAASTGGPPALERVFSGLSASMPAAYVVVQHLPKGFADSLARRLSGVTDVRVSLAESGVILQPGHGYLAPYGSHLVLEPLGRSAEFRFTDDVPLHGVRPAGDPLLISAASVFGQRAIGVVLTGMGSDGAEGAKAIREAGGETIVQDEPTSVVWGMPGSVVKAKAASHVVPLQRVAAEIRRSVRMRTGDSAADV